MAGPRTIVKAKYIRTLEGSLLDGQLDLEALKQDNWSAELLREAVGILEGALSEESLS
jgi:hypothetical protein